MAAEVAIAVRGLGKAYRIYDRPADRLKQMFLRRRRYYREFWALRNVTFDVRRGETVGIIGRNGAGKSTLLQIISGTVAATEGEAIAHGRVAALLALGAGFNLEFTGRENVFVNAAVLGLTETEIRDRLDDIIAFADIGRFIDQPVRTYSSGMYARLAFAVAIHVNPDVLIVDEILAVGDAAFQRKCIQKFYQIRDGGCTILFVSHDPYQVKSVCQRALYLRDGEPLMFGPAADVIDRYTRDTEGNLAADRVPVVTEDLPPPVEVPPPFRIVAVTLENEQGDELEVVESGQDIRVRMRYDTVVDEPPPRISFVVNLYRHDDLYVYGSTTLMDGIAPFPPAHHGEVVIRFPRIALLAGSYKWRVAINDDRGFITHAERKDVCPMRVVDSFRAVGLVDLPRQWEVRSLEPVSRLRVGGTAVPR
jgi:ABC-type polysaccharide/polyol phosphate transport system ATPase subunit